MSREQTCKKFRTYWRKSQEVSEQIRLTVTHFLILNWQKKVKRQGWDCIFQKKKKGLKSSELFYLLFCGCNCIFFLLYLSPSRLKLQQETSNQRAFFFLQRQNNSVVCCFPFTCKYCPKKTKILFQTIERDCFGWRGECFRLARTMQTSKTFLRTNIRLDLTNIRLDLTSSPFFSWDFLVKRG